MITVRRRWPLLRLLLFLGAVFATVITPFVVAFLVFGAPWWIMYFVLVPQSIACEWARGFAVARGWLVI